MADAKLKGDMTLEQAMDGLPPDFAFFAERFRTQIQPGLAAREDTRLAAVKKQRDFGVYGVLAGAAIAGLSWLLLRHPIGVVFGVFAGFGLYAWGSRELAQLGRETKQMLVEPVVREFGMTYELAPAAPADILRLRDLGLVPSWDRATFEDKLSGQRQNAPFEFFEAHLEDERRTTDSRGNTRREWVTVFRGQCLVARFPKPFNGVTKVERDHGAMNFFAKLGQGMPKVKLEDPLFEKAFEVYGTDQIEARFILTPDFMERLLKLEKTFEGKQLRCAFQGGEMLLCVEGKNLFEPGSMYIRMDDLSRVQDMLHDFAAVFLLIDAMVARRTPEALRP
jgi:Protein of unknown function (DUF3137)